jgi:hypothetical protein
MSTGGRPLVLTETIIKKTYEIMRAGNYRPVAARLLQIEWTTWTDWRTAGEKLSKGLAVGGVDPTLMTKSQKLYLKFYQAVVTGEAEAEAEALSLVRTASFDNWQAAAWYLARKHPEKWSEKQRVEHTGLPDRPVVVQIANQLMLDPESRKLMSQLVPKLIGVTATESDTFVANTDQLPIVGEGGEGLADDDTELGVDE